MLIQSILSRRPRMSGRRLVKSAGRFLDFLNIHVVHLVAHHAHIILFVSTSFCSVKGAVSNMTAMDAKYEYEYLIKYKNLSYLHIQWLSGSEIGTLQQPFFFISVRDQFNNVQFIYFLLFPQRR